MKTSATRNESACGASGIREAHTAGTDSNGPEIGMANARRLSATWNDETLLSVMRSVHPRGKYAHFRRICRDELARRAQARAVQP